jgi:hypothetical protein
MTAAMMCWGMYMELLMCRVMYIGPLLYFDYDYH